MANELDKVVEDRGPGGKSSICKGLWVKKVLDNAGDISGA
jgi:hypothetical protein